jgi:hypothetical protein
MATPVKYSQKRWTEMFDFLDELRESGATNMFGSSPYIMEAFGVGRDEASHVVGRWMKTFSRDVPPSERVRAMFVADAAVADTTHAR